MSAEPYLQWSARAHRGLEQLPRTVADRMQSRRRTLAADAARRAPRRTGRLARSLRGTVSVTSRAQVDLQLHSDHPAAGIQDTGGSVRRGSRHLAVPIGTVRVPVRSAVGTFVLKSRDGRRFIAQRLGGGGVRLLARLMDEVQVPGTGYASAAFDRAASALPVDLTAAVDQAVG